MVTRAAKDLLKNTIRSTGYHNKLMEEEEMWRHWELSRGLTMMVSDDYIRTRMRMDEYTQGDPSNGGRKRERHSCSSKDDDRPSNYNYHFTRELVEAQKADENRWGHSGYIEMYPEEFQITSNDDDDVEEEKRSKRKSSSSSSSSSRKKHKKLKRHRKRGKVKKHKRKRTKSKNKCLETDSETDELRQDIRNERLKKRGLEPVLWKRKRKRKRRKDVTSWSSSQSSSSTDNDVRIIGIATPRKQLNSASSSAAVASTSK